MAGMANAVASEHVWVGVAMVWVVCVAVICVAGRT